MKIASPRCAAVFKIISGLVDTLVAPFISVTLYVHQYPVLNLCAICILKLKCCALENSWLQLQVRELFLTCGVTCHSNTSRHERSRYMITSE